MHLALLELCQHGFNFLQSLFISDINTNCNLLDICIQTAGKIHQLIKQKNREIVDTEKSYIFHHLHCCTLTRARHSCHNNKSHTLVLSLLLFTKNTNFRFQRNSKLLLHFLLYIMNQLQNLCCRRIPSIDYKSTMLLRNLCISHTITAKPRILN